MRVNEMLPLCYSVCVESEHETQSLGTFRGFCFGRKVMPRKPDKPCSYPGCPNLVPAGQSFCSEHMKQMNQRYERFGRDPETKKRYGRQWERIRRRYIAAHPLCEECQRHGRYVKAEHVHHVRPLSEGGTHDEDNLMALCRKCHSKIHAERGDRWGR